MRINSAQMLLFIISAFAIKTAFAETLGLIHYAEPQAHNMPKIQVLSPQEDNLYAGADILPYDKELSEKEKQQEENSDLEYITSEYQRPELTCSQIQPRIKEFILKNLQTENINSVIEKRRRILMVKNMSNFRDVTEEEVSKKNFETQAALMHLKINERREIYRICASSIKAGKQSSEVYVIIYPYLNYYKAVVSNLIKVPEELESATLIYDWQ